MIFVSLYIFEAWLNCIFYFQILNSNFRCCFVIIQNGCNCYLLAVVLNKTQNYIELTRSSTSELCPTVSVGVKIWSGIKPLSLIFQYMYGLKVSKVWKIDQLWQIFLKNITHLFNSGISLLNLVLLMSKYAKLLDNPETYWTLLVIIILIRHSSNIFLWKTGPKISEKIRNVKLVILKWCHLWIKALQNYVSFIHFSYWEIYRLISK